MNAKKLNRGLAPVFSLMLLGAVSFTNFALATPVLQVAAPAGSGDTGTFADYQGSTSNPTETDTAITSGDTIIFAGLFQNNNVISLGSANTAAGGGDWSSLTKGNTTPFAFDGGVWGVNPFDTYGAVVVATVPDGSVDATNTTTGLVAGKTLSLDIGTLIYATGSGIADLFPNNHDPLKDDVGDFLFFDIGDFSELVAILNYADETAGSQMGSIQTATVSTSGLDWIHFDLMAIETSQNGPNIVTTWENNPGSHDVTWKSSSSSSSTGGGTGSSEIPEPGTVSLLGIAVLGGLLTWRRHRARI